MYYFKRFAAMAFALSATNAANAADGTQAAAQALAISFYQQIVRCWSPPIPSNESQGIVVRLLIHLNEDGQVAGPPTLIDKLDTSAPSVNEAINAATRAVYACAPYRLPAEQYSMWKQIVLAFDPRVLSPSTR